jgi:hypothetical protein
MQEPDIRLLKAIQQVDTERAARLKAERAASALKAMNVKLRQQLATATRDQAPTVEHIR